jgi:oxalate---CoA ligase
MGCDVTIGSVRGVVAVVPTLADALQNNAVARPSDAALICPQRGILTYAELSREIAKIGDVLRSANIGQRAVVALALPAGPELALAIAGVACHAVAVPLNPAATVEELDDLFRRLHIAALVIPANFPCAARVAAERHGAALLEVEPATGRAIGLAFNLVGTAPQNDPIAPIGCALIFQTSGTTARSKLVPITHTNLFAAAERVRHWYGLTQADRCLAVAPLHYGYGIRISLLVPLILGSSTICPMSCSPERLLDLLAEQAPTWYCAGPAFHGAVLELARTRIPIAHALRFTVCGGAPVPDFTRRELEDVLAVAVLDSYGLSETGHIAANMAPPGPRKPGTVGVPWPGELRIIADDGSTLESGQIGEVVVRGPGVMLGYLDDETPLIDGWFCTGDVGLIDEDGFLALRGRVKDMINRGGEKIAPLEIDNALLAHPSVKDAAAFAVPHSRLGQHVAVAVVPHNQDRFDALELRRYLRGRLAPVKVPRRIFVVSEVPRNSAGKVKRDALTETFQHAADIERGRVPLSVYEILIADIWKELLGRDDIGVDDDFFEKGGDSLLAVRMLLEVEALFDMKVPEDTLFEAATIRQIFRSLSEGGSEQPKTIIQLHDGSAAPVFFFHADLVGGGVYARRIAPLLGTEHPFYLVTPHGAHGQPLPDTIEEMAAERLEDIRRARPQGPYIIAGFCSGGLVAMEVAHRLMAAGETVEAVLIIEPISFNARPTLRLVARLLRLSGDARPNVLLRRRRAIHRIWALLMKANAYVERGHCFRRLPRETQAAKLAQKLRGLAARIGFGGGVPSQNQPHEGDPRDSVEQWDTEVWVSVGRAMAAHIPRLPPTRVICYVGKATPGFKFSSKVWKRLGPIEIVEVSGEHLTCITTHVTTLAEAMGRDLRRLAPGAGQPAYDRTAGSRDRALTEVG